MSYFGHLPDAHMQNLISAGSIPLNSFTLIKCLNTNKRFSARYAFGFALSNTENEPMGIVTKTDTSSDSESTSDSNSAWRLH